MKRFGPIARFVAAGGQLAIAGAAASSDAVQLALSPLLTCALVATSLTLASAGIASGRRQSSDSEELRKQIEDLVNALRDDRDWVSATLKQLRNAGINPGKLKEFLHSVSPEQVQTLMDRHPELNEAVLERLEESADDGDIDEQGAGILRDAQEELSRIQTTRLEATLPAGEVHLHQRVQWTGAPALPRCFVARPRESAQLHRAVVSGMAPIVIVRAIGGQGKTTLVANWLWVHARKHDLPFDDICYFSAYRYDQSFLGVMDAAADFLGGERRGNPDLSGMCAIVMEAMRSKRVLLVLDGIERWLLENESRLEQSDAKGLDSLLADVTHLGNGSRLVLTTRSIPGALDAVDPGKIVFIGGDGAAGLKGMEPRESLLLLKRLGVSGARHEKERCIEELGGHPLSLTILAALLRQQRQTIEQRHALYPQLALQGQKIASILTQAERLTGNNAAILAAAAVCPEEAPVEALFAALDTPQGADAGLWLILDRLERWGLIGLGGPRRDCLNMHPLVREHFASVATQPEQLHRRLARFFASQPISENARSISRVASRVRAVEHAVLAGDFDFAIELYNDRPLANGRQTLAKWFQQLGQSAFELDWLSRLLPYVKPLQPRLVFLTAMMVAAHAIGADREAARLTRLIEELMRGNDGT
jgi:hypothetical protein